MISFSGRNRLSHGAICFPYISLHTISPDTADAELQFSSPVEIYSLTAGTVAQLMQGPQPDISDLLRLCQLPLQLPDTLILALVHS